MTLGSVVSQLKFDRSMVEGLERLYATRDVLRRRHLVHSAIAAEPGGPRARHRLRAGLLRC